MNKGLQFMVETLLMALLGYGWLMLFPNLPWWTILLVYGVIAFILHTEVPSFWTGFFGLALLWGFLAFQINTANEGILAHQVGELFKISDGLAAFGGSAATRMVILTAIFGGLLGGFAAMTGALGRTTLWPKKSKIVAPTQ